MGNSQHMDWLKEGVSSWNARQGANFADPQLDGEDVSRWIGGHEREDIRQISAQLRGINLSKANLRNSTLRDTDLSGSHFFTADLTGAKLIGSRFEGSMFVDSQLTRADLMSASLENTKLWLTNLNSAILTGTNAKGAEFWECDLNRTHLYSTDLSGARFIRSRPWRANLFWSPDQQPLEPATLEIDTIKGINDLLAVMRDLRTAYGDEVTLYFRGESREFEELNPSVMRKPREGQQSLRPVESEMLIDLLTRQPDAFSGLNSTLSQWVMAQHHRLSTRLLDITRNPQVALFFASNDDDALDGRLHVFAVPKSLIKSFNSDEVSLIANFAKLPRAEQNLILGKTEEDTVGDEYPPNAGTLQHGPQLFSKAVEHLHSIIRRERPDYREPIEIRDLYRVFLVEPQQIFSRIRAQSGAFLISAFHERFEQREILKANPETPIYAHHVLKVAGNEKKAILNDLRSFNVDRVTLFPSVDETATAITRRYLEGSTWRID